MQVIGLIFLFQESENPVKRVAGRVPALRVDRTKKR